MVKKTNYCWVILFCACMMMGVSMGIMGQSAGIFFAPVTAELGFGRGPLAVYVSIQAICTFLITPFAGRMISKVNFRVLQSMVAILTCCGFAAMSQYNSLIQWYISGAIIGTAKGFTAFLVIPILLNNWFKKKIGFVIGIAMSFSGVGGAVFNMLGNFLINNYGWRMGYLGLGIAGLILLLPCTIFLVRFKPSDMGLLAYGEEESTVSPGSAAQGAKAAVTGVPQSIAVKSVAFWLVWITAGLLAFNGIFVQHVTAYVVSIGMSATIGASAVSVYMIVSIFSKTALGWCNDKYGILVSSVISIILAIGGLLVLLMAERGPAMVFLWAVLFGLGIACSSIEPPLLVKQIFGTKDYNAIYSYVIMALNLVAAVGVAAFGYIYDFLGSYKPAILLICASFIICLIAITAALKLGKGLMAKYGQDSIAANEAVSS